MDLNALINSDGTDNLKRKNNDELDTQESLVVNRHSEQVLLPPPPSKILKSESENDDSEYEYEEGQGTIDEINKEVLHEVTFRNTTTVIPTITSPPLTETTTITTIQQIIQPQNESFSNTKSLCVILALGRLTSDVRLFPDPTPIIESEKRAEPKLQLKEFPKCLSIVGFLNAKTLPSPPSISSHRILPLNNNNNINNINNNINNNEIKEYSNHNSEQKNTEILALMLSSALFTQRLTAVVALGPEWRGIITAPTLGRLVFHILKPRIVLPGIGSLHTLTTFSSLMLAGCTSFREPEIPLEIVTHGHRGKSGSGNGTDSGSGNRDEEMMSRVPFERIPLLPERNMVYASFAQFEKLTFSLPGSFNELSKIFDRIVLMSDSFHDNTNITDLFCTFVQKCYSNAESRKQQGISLFKELYEKSKHYQKNQL